MKACESCHGETPAPRKLCHGCVARRALGAHLGHEGRDGYVGVCEAGLGDEDAWLVLLQSDGLLAISSFGGDNEQDHQRVCLAGLAQLEALERVLRLALERERARPPEDQQA